MLSNVAVTVPSKILGPFVGGTLRNLFGKSVPGFLGQDRATVLSLNGIRLNRLGTKRTFLLIDGRIHSLVNTSKINLIK